MLYIISFHLEEVTSVDGESLSLAPTCDQKNLTHVWCEQNKIKIIKIQ